MSAPVLEFVDATPVKRTGAGRPAEPNPFADVVKSIAGQVDSEGKPLARAFSMTYRDGNDDDKKTLDKFLRQLSDAGTLTTPQVTVHKDVSPTRSADGKRDLKDKITVTFWTGPRITRQRKPVGTTTGIDESPDALVE